MATLRSWHESGARAAKRKEREADATGEARHGSPRSSARSKSSRSSHASSSSSTSTVASRPPRGASHDDDKPSHELLHFVFRKPGVSAERASRIAMRLVVSASVATAAAADATLHAFTAAQTRGANDGGKSGTDGSVFADALHAAHTMARAYDAVSRACVDADLADGVCALRRLQGARGLLAVGKRAAVAARTWAACLSLCSPIDDAVEMQLALVLQSLSAKLARACTAAGQTDAGEPPTSDEPVRTETVVARLRVRREYVRLLDAWHAMACSVLPPGASEKLESHMTAAKKAQSLTDRYEQQVKRERAERTERTERQKETELGDDESPPGVAGEGAAKPRAAATTSGQGGRVAQEARRRARMVACASERVVSLSVQRVPPDCVVELVAALDGSERERRLRVPERDAAHDSERTAELQKTLASMVVADTALRRTRVVDGFCAAAAPHESGSSVRSRLSPEDLSERMVALATAAEGEFGGTAMRDLLLSFLLPRHIVGVRHTLLLTREAHQQARIGHGPILNHAHSVAMMGAIKVWEDEHALFGPLHRACALLSGFAMLTSPGGRDALRVAVAFDGLVQLPFLIERSSRVAAVGAACAGSVGAAAAIRGGGPSSAAGGLFDSMLAADAAHLDNCGGASSAATSAASERDDLTDLSMGLAVDDVDERARKRDVAARQAMVEREMQLRLLVTAGTPGVERTAGGATAAAPDTSTTLCWVLCGHPELAEDLLKPAAALTPHRPRCVLYRGSSLVDLGVCLAALFDRYAAVVGSSAGGEVSLDDASS